MKAFCSLCKRETNHEVLFEKKRKINDAEVQVVFYDEWQIIQCKGCENISFRHASSNSDDYDPVDGTPYESIRLYPQRGEDILPIKGYYYAPLNVRNIYRETIDAYNNGLYLLCAGGLRATIESICNSEGIVDGPVDKTKPGGPNKIVRSKDLMGKINGLHEKGLITKKQSEILHEHRYLGNDALHSLDTPSKNSLNIAIEIVEHTLDALYEIGDKADQLVWQRQKRKKKKAK
ncbi:MAG: DUF4145 domain-containing protein [Cyclobacteriaceae bacterium]|jgi:hypothetical protein|nr:DUF4145 domain-containing protein [Cyclobacteriaceae bacterium]